MIVGWYTIPIWKPRAELFKPYSELTPQEQDKDSDRVKTAVNTLVEASQGLSSVIQVGW